MYSNLPPGMSDKELENPWGEIREQIADDTEVRYELKVYCDDELVFASDYGDDASLQEELRKPERAVEDWIDKATTYKMEIEPDYDED